MPIDVLIDGYNLLHAAGLAKAKYAPGELDRRRTRLLARLKDLLDPAILPRTTVVFDARINPPPVRPDPPSGPIVVIFAPRDREADDVVEELLAKHSTPGQVLVVSSDHRLHKAARRRGATPIDSDAFLDQLEVERPVDSRTGPRTKTEQRTKSVGKPSTADAAMSEMDAELHRLAEAALSAEATRPLPSQSEPLPGASVRLDPDDPMNDPAFWEKRIRGGDH